MDLAAVKGGLMSAAVFVKDKSIAAAVGAKDGIVWLGHKVVVYGKALATGAASLAVRGWHATVSGLQYAWTKSVPYFTSTAKALTSPLGLLGICMVSAVALSRSALGDLDDEEKSTGQVMKLVAALVLSVAAGALATQAGIIPFLV